MSERLKKQVIDDCRWYMAKYNCTLVVALDDWEGDGPDGSWGLTQDERQEVLEEAG